MKKIAVTGGAGQIAYSLLFRIASGDFLGHNQSISLHLLDLPDSLNALKAIKMELEDCAFPLLKEVKIGSDPDEIFEGVDYAFLVGAKPRGPGMERKDLLKDNGKIFAVQAKALNDRASKDVKVLVVGNPCNTNCLIAIHNAPNLNYENFHAMTRLDQNRAKFQLAQKASVSIEAVSNVTIWGNHSSTQVPDFFHAQIKSEPVTRVIEDGNWLKNEFFSIVQKRGASVIELRGKSSAASAANAAIDAMRSIVFQDNWFSSGVYTKQNPYGIDPDLVFSFPCKSNGKGEVDIIKDLEIDEFLQQKLLITEKELIEERDLIRGLLR